MGFGGFWWVLGVLGGFGGFWGCFLGSNLRFEFLEAHFTRDQLPSWFGGLEPRWFEPPTEGSLTRAAEVIVSVPCLRVTKVAKTSISSLSPTTWGVTLILVESLGAGWL